MRREKKEHPVRDNLDCFRSSQAASSRTTGEVTPEQLHPSAWRRLDCTLAYIPRARSEARNRQANNCPRARGSATYPSRDCLPKFTTGRSSRRPLCPNSPQQWHGLAQPAGVKRRGGHTRQPGSGHLRFSSDEGHVRLRGCTSPWEKARTRDLQLPSKNCGYFPRSSTSRATWVMCGAPSRFSTLPQKAGTCPERESPRPCASCPQPRRRLRAEAIRAGRRDFHRERPARLAHARPAYLYPPGPYPPRAKLLPRSHARATSGHCAVPSRAASGLGSRAGTLPSVIVVRLIISASVCRGVTRATGSLCLLCSWLCGPAKFTWPAVSRKANGAACSQPSSANTPPVVLAELNKL